MSELACGLSPARSVHLFLAGASRRNCTDKKGTAQTKRGFPVATKRKRKYSRGASKDVAGAMRRRKRGTLKSGKGGRGGKVKSRKQAIAIGLSEARKKGKRVPRKRRSR
jgi:hypothetical protein